MKVSDLGEFGLIRRLRSRVKGSGQGLTIGIGDDAAGFETPDGMVNLATCDVQVEGVHFLRSVMSPFQIGRKAAAINISDIAAMGGDPCFMLVSLGLPEDLPVSFVDELYQGLEHECGLFDVRIIGGNMARSPERIFIDIFLLGRVEKGAALVRSGARAGDLIGVTGTLGNSAAGLELLLDDSIQVPSEVKRRLVQAHVAPNPRVEQGRLLANLGLASAALDVSDGAAADAAHICEESNLSAVLYLDRIPVSDSARAAASAAGKNVMEYALFGGEDYELLFTAPENAMDEISAALKKTGTSATIIGCMEQGAPEVRILDENGSPVDMKAAGWDHFSKQ